LDEIATRRRQSISGQWPSDRDIATILKKTSGLFIIASVILRFIDSSFASPQKRLKLIVDPPESTIYEGRSGIDVVYHQILSASFELADEDDGVGSGTNIDRTLKVKSCNTALCKLMPLGRLRGYLLLRLL
jgi:hypothetical protein